ncbi:hypothetical protein DPX16_2368 [Anabarilius grahami]|uniref:Tyr recombinase domain-containing protein n=1 Tax=Anabarilius grahami TaxID=495550 RepID=A0A3N0XUM2_ANAGA|nr:hypothetical protein DPX16_2368 [Anabarilius grahami]
MDTSDILGQILSEESPDEILDHYTEDSDPTQLVRRCSRIAARNPFSISEWPKERILATLYSLNVQVPSDLNQDELLTFLQEVNQDPQPPSTNVSSLPRSTGRKATEKRKNISNDQASPTSKKVKTSNPPQASAQHGDDRVLTALLSIQGSLSDMDNRIQALESQRSASAPRAMFDGQTSSSTSNCALFPDLALPRRSLGSALPAASTGVPFFPPAAAISPQLRAQILSGISFHTEYFSIYLKHSKTDRDYNGSTINISRTNDGYCPLTAMNRLVSSRSKSNPADPLFITEKGEAMSKHWFASRLRTACLHCGMDPALYTSHSFRIGAATTAASTVSIPMLKAMGRWSSSAYQRYIRPTTQDVLLAQKALSSSYL